MDKSVTEPLSGEPENLIGVINQGMIYMVSIMAVEYLYRLYPEQIFRINWGNVAGLSDQLVDILRDKLRLHYEAGYDEIYVKYNVYWDPKITIMVIMIWYSM